MSEENLEELPDEAQQATNAEDEQAADNQSITEVTDEPEPKQGPSAPQIDEADEKEEPENFESPLFTDVEDENFEEDEDENVEDGNEDGQEESSEQQIAESQFAKREFPRSDEQARTEYLMSEYMKIVMAIDSQNRMVNDLKKQIFEKCQKCPRTKCDEREVHNLRCCLEKENLKLQCLIRKAINMQNENPTQSWGGIKIATSVEEDILPFNTTDMLSKTCGNLISEVRKSVEGGENYKKSCSTTTPLTTVGGVDNNELEKFLDCLLRQMKKSKSYKPSSLPKSCSARKKNDKTDCEDQINKIISALQKVGACSAPRPQNTMNTRRVENELNRSYNMQEKLVADNSSLERDRFKMQEELLCRDRIIDCLQQKIQLLQSEICKKRRGKLKKMTENFTMTHSPPPELTDLNVRSATLINGINKMQSSVERLKMEMDCLRKERDQFADYQAKHQVHSKDIRSSTNTPRKQQLNVSPTRRETKFENIQYLKQSYRMLLADYAKKETELKQLKNKVNSYIEGTENAYKSKEDYQESTEDVEIKILQEKLNDLTEEQEEFKFLIKEQAQQLEEIRCKYLIAQQKVEEQKCILEKTNMSRRQVEEQVASEIQRITQKFQQKCAELMKFPKLLEDEQLKLANCIKEKDEVQQKLNIVCNEYSALKRQYENNADGPENVDWMTKATKIEQEVLMFKEKCKILKNDKNLISDMLLKAKNDYECLTIESGRILAWTKDRAEQQKNILTDHTNKLEKELAQCRAAGSLNITDREELIKEMQGQIKALCYSFDAAKDQITNLQSQISSLSGSKM